MAQSWGFGTAPHTVGSVSTASIIALSANANRRYALFINDSDTVIYLKLGATAVANQGIRLNGGGTASDRYEMTIGAGNLYTGAVHAIHGGSGTKILLVTEGTVTPA